MRRALCLLAVCGWSACTFPAASTGGPIVVGCITVEHFAGGRHGYTERWIGLRRASVKEVDAELRRWPPAAAEESRYRREVAGAVTAFLGGSTAMELGVITAAGGLTDGREEPYGLFLVAGGVVGMVSGLVLGRHLGIHDDHALELYDDAAKERDQCPIGAPAK